MNIDDFYEYLYQAYKKYIENNSSYGVKVVKYYNNNSPYFPITTFEGNDMDTDKCTNGYEEFYQEFYITINHYSKDKVVGTNQISAKVINDETRKLTMTFMRNLNFKKTLDKPTPNLDNSIFRNTMQYQGMVGNQRLNIIRR